MYSIGRLAKKYSLSRSTLLYYDRLDLLKPSLRTGSNYRMYSEQDATRLEKICLYRQAGIKLKDIAPLLESPDTEVHGVLENRLRELNGEIGLLRRQQQFIAGLLKNSQFESEIGVMNRRIWVSLLRAAGFDEEAMHNWHRDFEHHSPEKHHAFLEFLCIPEAEIKEIRNTAAQSL